MLRDEVEQYTKLTGEDGWKVPIMKVGTYLTEIEQERVGYPLSAGYYKEIIKCLQIIYKYKEESEE